MSYNQGYGQSGQGYGQYNPYGQQNPYSDNNTQGGYGSPQRETHQSPRPGGYGAPQSEYGQNTYGQYQDERNQGGYEMGAMGNQGRSDPNQILNEVRQIDESVKELEDKANQLRTLQSRSLAAADGPSDAVFQQQVNEMTEYILHGYRALVSRINIVKNNPESGNPRNSAQVGKVDRQLRESLNKFQQLESNHRQEQREQLARQYRIVRPEASDQEIREFEQNTDGQPVFSQAMMSSDRRDQAMSTSKKVQNRHEKIQKMEKDFVEIAQLMNDLEAAVVQQEVAVTQIGTKADETKADVENAAVQLDGAADKARAARKKKWICTGIVVAILIVIAIVVAVAVSLTRNTNPSNNNNP